MKNNTTILVFLFNALVLSSYGQSSKFTIVNLSNQERVDEAFVLTRPQIEKLFGKKPADGKIPLVVDKGEPVVCQADDVNSDGHWDEVSMLVSVPQNSEKVLTVKMIKPDELPVFEKRTNIRMGINADYLKKEKVKDIVYKEADYEERPEDWKPQQQPPRYQMEGPGWENDVIAFRNYFDERNGMDIFGKLTTAMVLDRVDGTIEDYHKLCAWGMDVLKVGTSLGAGGIALSENGAFYPLKHTRRASFKKIFEGPIRSRLKLSYLNWDVNGKTFNLDLVITIWAGKNAYQCDVNLKDFEGSAELATGIVNLKNPNPPKTETLNSKFIALIGHGKQSENNDILAMGLMLSASDFVGYAEAPKISPALPNQDTITHTSITRFKVLPDKPVSYWFFAGWEKANPKFKEYKYFLDLMRKEADALNDPLQLKN